MGNEEGRFALYAGQNDGLREIVDGTGWRVRRFIDDAGPLYCAILEHQ